VCVCVRAHNNHLGPAMLGCLGCIGTFCVLCARECICVSLCVCRRVLSELILFSLLTGSKKEVRPWLAAVINALPQ